jgi:hypothetical protein
MINGMRLTMLKVKVYLYKINQLRWYGFWLRIGLVLVVSVIVYRLRGQVDWVMGVLLYLLCIGGFTLGVVNNMEVTEAEQMREELRKWDEGG